MNREDIFKACPALGRVFQEDASLRPAFEELLRRSLAGVFSRYLKEATEPAVRTLLGETRLLDFEQIERHLQARREKARRSLSLSDVHPVPLVTLESQQARRERDEELGLSSLSRGEWAAVAFAGGAGTRFFSRLDELQQALPRPNEALRAGGFDPQSPKGVFPISPVGGLSFYEIIVAEALEAGVVAGRLPWVLLLTSLVTNDRTVDFLSTKDLWGFPRRFWCAFQQARHPRLDQEGQLIVADDQGHLSWTGDGHGGVYRALLARREEGRSLLERLGEDSVAHLVMHNVDNPAARPFAPARLGFHLDQRAHFTMSAVRKTDPDEKVGLLMLLQLAGRVEVVEYNVLDREVSAARDAETGRLLHEAGNVNTNLIAASAVSADLEPTLYTGKTVPSRIGPVSSSSLEMLNQHITRRIDPRRVRAFEVERREFFMPTKNMTGADSVESTTRMLSSRFAGLLRAAGAEVHPDALCDLHPACGGAAELARRGLGPGWKLGEGARLYLCVRRGDPSGAPVGQGALTVEDRGSLVVQAARPYGRVEVDASRRLRAQEEQASCLSIGRGVVIETGRRVVLRIGPGARLRIPAGRAISTDLDVEVGPGRDAEL